MASSIKVNILGEEFPVKVNTDQEEYIREVVQYVIDKMEEAKTITKENSTKRIAVLAALNITAEFLKRDKNYRDNASEIERILKEIGL
ncbi:MAG TPA: cell division protein ZapA [Clostridiales bacterium]|jgi:cell division protein ZapA (FtsZ GTPase activity inhibitor)|nr:cell division protein ZapA [Clostridiales bacterium]HQP69079.1 cell division protein ZapA [Clostridiales bacterium]